MNYDIEEVVFMYFDKFLDLLKLAFRQKAAVYDAVEFFKNFFSNGFSIKKIFVGFMVVIELLGCLAGLGRLAQLQAALDVQHHPALLLPGRPGTLVVGAKPRQGLGVLPVLHQLGQLGVIGSRSRQRFAASADQGQNTQQCFIHSILQ